MKTLLFNPFKKYSEQQLLVFGLVTALISIFLSGITNTYFFGLFKIHHALELSIITAILEYITIALCYVIVLYSLGRYINPKVRIIDIINVVLIAKIPLAFLTFLNINDWAYRQTENLMQSFSDPYNLQLTTELSIFLAVTSVLAISALVWLVILLYNGFKTASNFKDTKHIFFLIISVIATETIIRYILKNFIY